MTPREIAKLMIDARVTREMYILAEAYLLQEQKLTAMQKVVDAAREFWFYLPIVENKHSDMATKGLKLRKALAELDGEAK